MAMMKFGDVFLEFLDVIYACWIHLILSVDSVRLLGCSFQINVHYMITCPSFTFKSTVSIFLSSSRGGTVARGDTRDTRAAGGGGAGGGGRNKFLHHLCPGTIHGRQVPSDTHR